MRNTYRDTWAAIGIVWKSTLRPGQPLGPSLTTGKNPIMLRMFGEKVEKDELLQITENINKLVYTSYDSIKDIKRGNQVQKIHNNDNYNYIIVTQ